MPDNYIQTAKRMRESSQTLHTNLEFHNSCYMAGYVVECYLKIFFGLGFTTNTPRSFGHNIVQINANLQFAVSNSAAAAAFKSYLVDMATECPNISSTWNPNKRYEEETLEWVEGMSDSFQIEKEKCFSMIAKMKIDGVITM